MVKIGFGDVVLTSGYGFNVDFFCIGAPKCASTWLAQCLNEHPQISVSRIKEPNFFVKSCDIYRGSDNKRFLADWEWYKNLFDTTKTCGEFSVYLFMGGYDSAKIIHSYFPNAKLLLTLRDPVARAYSHYWHDRLLSEYAETDRKQFPSTFEEAIRNNNLLYLGRYYEQLRQWLDLFPIKSFCFVLDIDLRNDRSYVLRRVFEFLDVDPNFSPPSLNARVNSAAHHHPLYLKTLDIANALKKHHLGGFLGLTRAMGVNGIIQKAGTRVKPNPSIDPATERRLREYYLDDIRALEVSLGKSLAEWKTGRPQGEQGGQGVKRTAAVREEKTLW